MTGDTKFGFLTILARNNRRHTNFLVRSLISGICKNKTFHP